ncbi:MAG: antibiotic biosynthesis monooxygenase, partial [Salinivirgaceae bacterium]|nr:antibiotic biosynthesis monooxygenase [Salinivirgaceae bacterium]
MIVRIAEIEVYPEYLSEYLAFATEVDRLSVEREPGVICLFPMQDPADSCQIRILEIYANDAVYQAHLKTDHFQKYKQGTLKMVKSLKLNTMQPMDTEMMKAMFGKALRSVVKVRLGQAIPPGDWDEVVVAVGHEGDVGSIHGAARLALPLFTKEEMYNRLRGRVKTLLRGGFRRWEAADLAGLRMLRALGVDDITADWSLYA